MNMGSLFARRKACYCAFCKSERKVYRHKNMGWTDAFLALIASMAATYGIYHQFDPRGVYFFISLIILIEVSARMRWRINIICQNCGFDPVLYLRNQALAAEKVKNFLMRRKEDPAMLLKKPLNLPTVTPAQLEKAISERKAGQIISRQI